MNDTTTPECSRPVRLRAEERAVQVLLKVGLIPAAQMLQHGARLRATRRDRATTVSFYLGDQARYLVKLGKSAACEWSRREIKCYRAIDGIKHDAAIAPKLLNSNLQNCVLVIRLLDPAQTLHDYFATNPLDAPDVADRLATVIATLHALTAGKNLDVPSALPWVLSEESGQRDEHLRNLLPDTRERTKLLQLLSKARSTWREDALVHGDLKWDNCLLLTDETDSFVSVLLVDWELAGRGDPAWDLATALQEFWLRTPAAAQAGLLPVDYKDDNSAGRTANLLLTTYLRKLGVSGAQCDDLLMRTGLFTACRLVQSAFELAVVEDTAGSQEALALARWIGDNPDHLIALLKNGRAPGQGPS